MQRLTNFKIHYFPELFRIPVNFTTIISQEILSQLSKIGLPLLSQYLCKIRLNHLDKAGNHITDSSVISVDSSWYILTAIILRRMKLLGHLTRKSIMIRTHKFQFQIIEGTDHLGDVDT